MGNCNLSNEIDKETLQNKLWSLYGNCVQLVSNERRYFMESSYIFRTSRCLDRHPKEFSMKTKDVLYRNYYWIDSRYKTKEIYQNLRSDICCGKYKENNGKSIFRLMIKMDDGYDIFFIPEYYNPKTKSCLHYFDMSYFLGANMQPREFLSKILDFYEENEEYSLEYYIPDGFEKDCN